MRKVTQVILIVLGLVVYALYVMPAIIKWTIDLCFWLVLVAGVWGYVAVGALLVTIIGLIIGLILELEDL